MTPDVAWTKEETHQIRKRAYRFFLRDGCIWKHPKKRNGIPLRVVAKKEEQEEWLSAYHKSLGRAPWDVGHVQEVEGEVLVAAIVPGRASVRNNLRKLLDALHSPTPG